MDAIEALTNRVSCGKLTGPAPDSQQRDSLYRAALRAADHGNLQPWRFLEVEGQGLDALGALYEAAALQDNPGLPDAQRERYRAMPGRAPLVLVAIVRYSDHPKVPRWEQLVATGAAVQNIVNASFALGIGAYWRTGALTDHAVVRAGLGIQENESIIGFVYLGTCDAPMKPVPAAPTAEFFQAWPAK
ncbi:nitroreductase family protein [Pseudomaricurvus sp. HS19]|uniref:nitroreductase family protein n=1 Tax=Pseudomaricurvus sp. HS19 TaxID=2692626 RepID=UPI00136AA442|nr:nitroreductase family protein [Pseudomaricurvus sp. HS19]MYM61796.1 nitroreductase [Pseudomaricurvus sp. HS19]